MTANKEQVGGRHYADMVIQPFEYIHKNGIGFAEGSVIKYVSRWRKKGGIQDLEKARHVIDLLMEMERVVPTEGVAQKQAAGEWIEWLGHVESGPGELSGSDVVEVRLRDGRTSKPRPVNEWVWLHRQRETDIVAYRVVEVDTGGWLATAGPGCPVDSRRLVEVRFRDGSTDKYTAASYRWGWSGSPDDIVAYRVIAP